MVLRRFTRLADVGPAGEEKTPPGRGLGWRATCNSLISKLSYTRQNLGRLADQSINKLINLGRRRRPTYSSARFMIVDDGFGRGHTETTWR